MMEWHIFVYNPNKFILRRLLIYTRIDLGIDIPIKFQLAYRKYLYRPYVLSDSGATLHYYLSCKNEVLEIMIYLE